MLKQKKNFQKKLISSKRIPNLFETDRGKEFFKQIFQNFLKNNNVKHYSRNSSLAAVFAERFNRIIGDLLEKLDFERGYGNWIDILPTITKQDKIRIHSTIKLTLIQAG